MNSISNSGLINLGLNPSLNPSLNSLNPGLSYGINPKAPSRIKIVGLARSRPYTLAPYMGGKSFHEDKGTFPPGKKGHTKNKHRTPPELILHKNEIIVHLDTIDTTLVKEYAKTIFNNYTIKEKNGKVYSCTSISEKEGETITIYKYHNTGLVKIHMYTHKTDRLIKYRKLLEALGVTAEQVYRSYFEVYIRYHEIYETRVDITQEALLYQYGKRRKTESHMHREKKILYMDRVVEIEYMGYKCTIKTYRARNYSKLREKDPEYHPKLELSCEKKNTPLSEISIETITKLSTLLHTYITTLGLKPIYSEYDKQQEKIKVYGIDHDFAKKLKGVKKRIKAIHLLEQDYHDIRLAIAKLLVDYKMKQKDIARLLQYYSYRHIKRIVRELIDMGIIKRVGRGKYEWANRKAELPKTKLTRHTHVRSIQELADKIREIKTQHKLISVEYNGNIVINYETEHERVRLITNVISNSNYTEIIDPITRKRRIINTPRHKLTQLLNS